MAFLPLTERLAATIADQSADTSCAELEETPQEGALGRAKNGSASARAGESAAGHSARMKHPPVRLFAPFV